MKNSEKLYYCNKVAKHRCTNFCDLQHTCNVDYGKNILFGDLLNNSLYSKTKFEKDDIVNTLSLLLKYCECL